MTFIGNIKRNLGFVIQEAWTELVSLLVDFIYNVLFGCSVQNFYLLLLQTPLY